jgi:NitT/TauT family transport system substrate-binding protein
MTEHSRTALNTTDRPAPRKGTRLHRRALLGAGTATAATIMLGAAGRQAFANQASEPRKLKLAWNATAICTAAAPVAQESGIFGDNGLEIEFVNFGGSTEQLLEAIATGKADAGVGMALRWLKPLEQGFDVNITAGIHGGCMRLIGSTEQGITTLQDLVGKTIATADMASPGKNFFSIMLARNGIDPERDVTWRQFPGDLLPLTFEKGEAAAFVDGDPKTWLWLKQYPDTLTEIATNLTGEYANRTCCIVGIRGGLIRDEPEIAKALTQSLLAAGQIVGEDPAVGAAAFSKYGGEGSVEELTEMLISQHHTHQPVGDELKENIAAYAEELKLVNVFQQNTDPQEFATKVYANVLT